MTNTVALIAAMTAQLNQPNRSVVNSECAFVVDRLNKMGESSLGKEYWSWTCSDWQSNPKFGDTVHSLQTQLRAIDKQSTMPSWGTYGT